MRRLRASASAVPSLLAAVSYALAFAQRPGWANADTKINLHVDPGRFLADVTSMWSTTGQLGDVQTGQYAGYLFPMGPFYAAGHAVGLAPWVVQRLWLGTLLALAAWGVVRLLDLLLGGRRPVAALAGGAVAICNPLVVTYADRTTITLLAYVVLPWMLLCVHRGLPVARTGGRRQRWRWPAAFALLVAASGGGVNGAVTVWMLVGPVLLALYELRRPDVTPRDLVAAGWRTVLLTVLASLWWLIPAYIQSGYGIDFLHFTEQPGTVWGTTSLPEALRLMSFWLSYVGIGFAGQPIPYFDTSPTMLFAAPVVVATLIVPAVAMCGLALLARRERYAPFLLGLALLSLLIMGAGFPDGTPLRHGLYFAYNHVSPVRFLRASYKAAPLLAVAMAPAFGLAVDAVWHRLAAATRARPGARIAARTALGLGTGVLVALAGWPLVSGRAQDRQTSFRQIPAAWRAAASDLDRTLPDGTRAMVLPGELFAFYRWGGTADPILPVLSRRPVAERTEVPYADLRATDLLWTIDGLVHQRRLLPGQLGPLLSLAGIAQVVTGSDADLARSDAPPPADAAATLAGQPGFTTPATSYGPSASFAPTTIDPRTSLPQVRRYLVPGARPLVRLEPRRSPLVVDGSAAGLAELAAFGGLPQHRVIRFAADLTPAELRAAAADGGRIAVTDTNRRAAFVAGSLDQNLGPVLPIGAGVSADGLTLDPSGGGTDAQTVAAFGGIASATAPASPGTPQRPEHGAFAAIDGSLATSWLADPTLGPGRATLTIAFERPRDVPYVSLVPYDAPGAARVRAVTIAGRTFAVHPGANRLRLGLHGASMLQVALSQVTGGAPGGGADAGGITELTIPGLYPTKSLRAPVLAARALAGTDLSHSALSFTFERETGDDPFLRQAGALPISPDRLHAALGLEDAGDAEQQLHRTFLVPAARTFTVRAWVQPAPGSADSALDRLAGYRGPLRVDSSGRSDDIPAHRGSAALDGDRQTAWVAPWRTGGASLIVTAARPFTARRLTLVAPVLAVRRPTVVRVAWPGGTTPPLPVGVGGVVTLPGSVRARRLTIAVLASQGVAGATAAQNRAVGIAELRGLVGLPLVRPAPRPVFRCGSAAVRVGARIVPLAVRASAAALAAGGALPATGCGPPVRLPAGTTALAALPGPLAIDDLELSSPAPNPVAAPASAGAVGRLGAVGRASVGSTRVAVGAPAWLVLGQAYDRGWEASCNGHPLGAPVPIDAAANGWPVGPGCRSVRFSFGPQRLADAGYAASILAALACVALLGLGRWRTGDAGARPPAARTPAIAPPTPTPRLPLGHALATALVLGIAFGFAFGIRAGLITVPVAALVLWRGVGVHLLALTAAVLLIIVVPLLYLVDAPPGSGGNHAAYATQHLAAHWIAVAAFGLLAAALWRMLARRHLARARDYASGQPWPR